MLFVTDQGNRASLRRSVRLFRDFTVEQSDPDRFYSALAADSVAQVTQFAPIEGRTVLDVGGGPGYFRQAFQGTGAFYVGVDADLGELSARGRPEPGTVLGSGMDLPVKDGAVDICYSSNVLEHVRSPWRMGEEMLRVTRPGGIVFLSYTTWFSYWGGHETAPWHYFGGHRAAQRYTRVHGHPPKNRFGTSLFPVTVADGLAWARSTPSGELVAAFPRYHPWWAHGVVRIPLLREVATWNLVLVLRRR